MTATPQETELRVAGRTSTQELASAISHAVYDGKKVVLRAVGASAVNQAVKGLVVASQFVAARGQVLTNRPGFVNVEIDGEERTAVVFYVFVN